MFAGRSWSRAGGGDDRTAEPAQAVLREELAHPGLRRPQRDGTPRGAGLALQAAGGGRGPGRGLTARILSRPHLLVESTASGGPAGFQLTAGREPNASCSSRHFDSPLSLDSAVFSTRTLNQNHRYSSSFPSVQLLL